MRSIAKAYAAFAQWPMIGKWDNLRIKIFSVRRFQRRDKFVA
jgi:hypothetical protein